MPIPTRSTVRLLRTFRTPEGWTVEAGAEGTVVRCFDGGLELQVAGEVVLASPADVELTWRPDPPQQGARVRGCLLGGAVGDAFGAPYEAGHPPPLASRRLTTTDDTQLSLATCAAIVTAGRVDPAAIAEAFATEFRASRLRGLGASTYKALSELAVGGHWALVGHSGERSAGNGAAMRVAPLGFLLDPDDPDDRQIVRDVCRITHRHDEAYAGALAIVVGVHAARTGAWTGREDLCSLVAERLPDTLVRDRLRELAHQDAGLPDLARRYGAGGYVVESVPLAILAAQRVASTDFTGAVEPLVRLGGDADTLCSLTGQLVGACLGPDAVPDPLLRRLDDRLHVESVATRFAAFLG